jgi:hypothetical protein
MVGTAQLRLCTPYELPNALWWRNFNFGLMLRLDPDRLIAEPSGTVLAQTM